ncbi:sodium Bile acid symporter family protein [bacterium BMS3Abin02]|nr:sodium Bile acid symporter family protein [bacterium BMS3Abin02]GBE22718.1 sodium Bile acid symporter family protein [bacterium BMS3Bbin01]
MIDQLTLNFDKSSLLALNVLIGLMMLGVAMDLDIEDFRRLLRQPKPPAIGLGAQFILLPAFTYLLTLILHPAPSIALGMILVASCPGGNLSNIMTYLARGNAPLSVGMTAVSTAAAIVMTPLNFAFWGSLNPDTAAILTRVSLGPLDLFMTIFVILGIPLVLGMLIARQWPRIAARVRGPFKTGSVIVFMAFVAVALANNWSNFVTYIGFVVFAVFVHNTLAFFLGYVSARAARLTERDRRAVTIEVGLQNSALALILIFNFFDGLGGMALIAAWWGIWHIIAGLTVVAFWSRRPIEAEAEVAPA